MPLTSDCHVRQDDQSTEVFEGLLSLEELPVTTHLDHNGEESQSFDNELQTDDRTTISNLRGLSEVHATIHLIVPGAHSHGTQYPPDAFNEEAKLREGFAVLQCVKLGDLADGRANGLYGPASLVIFLRFAHLWVSSLVLSASKSRLTYVTHDFGHFPA